MFLLRECLKTLAGETSLPHQGMQIVEVVVKAKEEVGLAGGMWPPGVVLKGRQAQLATCVGSFWQGVCHSVCYHWYETDCSGSGNPLNYLKLQCVSTTVEVVVKSSSLHGDCTIRHALI